MSPRKRVRVIHLATVLVVSHTAAPSVLHLRCRRRATVPVTADTATWRASFLPARVTCRRCRRWLPAAAGRSGWAV